MRSLDDYMDMVTRDGMSLEFVPSEILNEDLCLAAVAENYTALRFVPTDIMTSEMCRLALEQSAYDIDIIPHHLMSDELYELAMKTAQDDGDEDTIIRVQDYIDSANKSPLP